MSKDFITVAAHKRKLPKRRFADGGVSSDRPDLDILAKQGLSPSKAPGLPPRIVNEYLAPGGSEAWTGGDLPVLERASKDEPSLDRGRGSVLSQMMDTSADRVQTAHDNARAAAALKAFHTGKRFADGGTVGDQPDQILNRSANEVDRTEDQSRQIALQNSMSRSRFADGGAYRTPEQIHEDRIREYGFDPVSNYMGNTDFAQAAAPTPIASASPQGSASRAQDPASSAGSGPADTGPSYPESKATVPVGTPTPSKEANSPAAPKPLTWQDVAKGALSGQSSSSVQAPISQLANIAGRALGTYIKGKAAQNKAGSTASTNTSASSPNRTGSDAGPFPSKSGTLGPPASGGKGGADGGPGSSGGGGGTDPITGDPVGGNGRGSSDGSGSGLGGYNETDTPGSTLPTEGQPGDWAGEYSGSWPDEFAGEEDFAFAEGGKVSPQQGMMQRRARPMRPGAPTPGAGSTLGAMPAGGPSYGGPPPGMGGMAGPAPGGPPPGPPPGSSMGPMAPPPGGPPAGGPPQMNSQLQAALAQRAQMGAMGGPPPGGPPPGGPPPGGPPPGGPGPQFGGMPPGGPPPGGPPRGMGGMMGGMGGPPPGGPPPGGPPPGGPPPGMAGMAAGMGGPPPGLPPGPPPGGPPPGPPAASSLGAMSPGAGGDPRAAMMAAMQAQQQAQGRPPGMATGGAVEDTEGDSPRAKGKRERQWGDVGKAAEDLPPEPEKKAKGGVIHKRPTGSKKKAAKKPPSMPVPMVTDADMDAPPPPMMAGPAGPPSGPPPGPPPPSGPAPAPMAGPPGMKEGGKCEAMAAGGVAKLRRGFPNTNKKPAKKMATGGRVRGCGVASKGKKFSGIY